MRCGRTKPARETRNQHSLCHQLEWACGLYANGVDFEAQLTDESLLQRVVKTATDVLAIDVAASYTCSARLLQEWHCSPTEFAAVLGATKHIHTRTVRVVDAGLHDSAGQHRNSCQRLREYQQRAGEEQKSAALPAARC